MDSSSYRVTFQPHGRTVYVLAGTKLLEAAGRAGLALQTPCGGMGTCGKCRVQLTVGAAEPSDADRTALSAEELAEGWRLACQTAVSADTVVDVPAGSLFGAQHQILTEAQATAAEEVLPGVRKKYVELPEPSLADAHADLVRLEQAIGAVHADLDVLRALPGALRSGGFRGTAVMADHHLIDFEPGDTTTRCFGVAADVGTTTIVVSLLDLTTGAERGIASAINPQVRYGDDVLARIQRCSEDGESCEQLREAALDAVNDLIGQVCAEAKVAREEVYEIALAGNTTMEHLLCGMDVAQLGCVPFVPVYGRGLTTSAAALGVAIHPRAAAYVFPVIGGFVGGDTVAGILATKLADRDGAALMIDIGTNGEIVVARDGQLWSASTAAGPAFEGARISCGMRATAGAIEKVVFDGDVQLNVIGHVAPTGLCGSGLIDLAAGLLDAGIAASTGRLLGGDELPADLPPALRGRVEAGADGQGRFVLARPDGADAIALTQRDVRELQLATGAIRAGVKILLDRAGLSAGDLDHVLIAGGFGSFIRRSKAQRIGLLPAEVDHSRITYVGNASLNGAKWALLSTDIRRQAEHVARHARHVQLSEDMNFQMEFAEAMIFPE